MQGMPAHGHEAVMVEEVVRWVSGQWSVASDQGEGRGEGRATGRVFVDCTVGRGGHAVRLARELAAAGGGMFVGMDVDPENLKYARQRVEEGLAERAGEGKGVEVRMFHANFGEVEDVLAAVGVERVDGLMADFGVSTNQILDAKHGLSFSADAGLDMRLDPRIRKKASDMLAELEEKELADILYEYAQERFAFRIARKIVQTRRAEPIVTTGQLARLVRSVVPGKWGQIDPATRTFQALRMAVNAELDAIKDLLAAVPGVMKPGGRCVFLSFHSGEDRLVKQAIRGWEERGVARALTKKPEEPGEGEVERNPRARSAKLRAAEFAGEPLGTNERC